MKLLRLIWMLLMLTPGVLKAQLPFISHAAPPGVTITTARMNDLVVDAANNKWVAFGNYGVGIYDGANWTMFNTVNSNLPSDSTVCIDFDASGDAWIGTKEGLAYKSGVSFTTFNTINSGLPSNLITAVHCDGNTIWIGSQTGLVHYDGTSWIVYNTGNSGIANDSITTIEKGNNGDVWIGTRNGLSRLNNGTWNNFTIANSTICRYISEIELDNSGVVWISGGVINFTSTVIVSGIFYIENNQVKSFENGRYFYDVPLSFSNADLFKDSNGNICFQGYFNNSNAKQLFRLTATGFDHYKIGNINVGVGLYGNIMTSDNNGLLWTLPRYRFHFYSMDFAGYVPSLLGTLHFDNFRTLDINDVRAGLNARGDMHWDYTNPKYEVPKGSGKHSVFASSLWIGALDQAGMLHTAAQTYRQTGNDFWPGPIDGINMPFDSSTCRAFDRIWKINKWKIEEFKNQFLAGNVSNGTYTIPEEFLTWPAKGNGIVDEHLAPFIDVNGDDLYNPMNGDYPLIIGDQMLFHIFNDSLAAHTESGGSKLGVEIQASAYAFHCQNIADSNQVLNWTTLYNYKIINRSITDYDSVYLGLWNDIDLGLALDDYVGCDTTRGTGFGYNGDNDDETMSGYGVNPPMQNVKILRGVLADPMDGIDNNLDGTLDEPGERTTMNHFMYYVNVNSIPSGNPSTAENYYSYLRSYWLDGTHLTDPNNNITNFMFSGVPYSGTGWTEGGAGGPPEDKRFIMSSGPFSLNAGDTATIDFAYIFTWDSLSPNGLTTSIARNQVDLDRVQYWFDANSFPSCETYTVGMENDFVSENFSVYPNPATTHLYIDSTFEIPQESSWEIYNVTGQKIMSGWITDESIHIASLSSQMYILKIKSSHGDQYLKFLKQ